MLPANGQARNLYLGDLAPDLATMERLVRDRMKFTRKPLLLYEEFCTALANLPRLVRARSSTPEDAPSALSDFVRLSERHSFTADFDGWTSYLRAQTPHRNAFDQAVKLPQYQREGLFPADGLSDAALIVATRGWGKSELLKAIVRHDIEAPNDERPASSLIVLDPGGDLVRQIAHWPELSGPARRSDRLVYIEPNLKPGWSVGINPLDGRGLDHDARNEAAAMLAEALDANTAPLSMNMETLIIHCATVLLARPGSTLRDLRDMLRDPKTYPKAAELYRYALAYPDPDTREFFELDFPSRAFAGTKEWLLTRLIRLFAVQGLSAMFGGETTVDLRAAIESRKVVLVNLEPLKAKSIVATAGRLLVAAVGGACRARADMKPGTVHAPINFVIDEVTLLAGRELVDQLALLRKRGLNLVMAQQVMGAGFSAEDKAMLIGNTGGRFVGGLDRGLIGDMMRVSDREASTLPKLEQRQFWASWRTIGGPHLLTVREDLAGYRLRVTEAEWVAYTSAATELPEAGGYYRIAKPIPAEADPPELRPGYVVPSEAPAVVVTVTPEPKQQTHVPTNQASHVTTSAVDKQPAVRLTPQQPDNLRMVRPPKPAAPGTAPRVEPSTHVPTSPETKGPTAGRVPVEAINIGLARPSRTAHATEVKEQAPEAIPPSHKTTYQVPHVATSQENEEAAAGGVPVQPVELGLSRPPRTKAKPAPGAKKAAAKGKRRAAEPPVVKTDDQAATAPEIEARFVSKTGLEGLF
ncbi:hypothetical protein [Methylorubrum sp. SB2]|uniref:hypothetical protein n=1 Tax=Methylorubrum subtropicum TaxID=3138812 RepID=UPI00313E94AF